MFGAVLGAVLGLLAGVPLRAAVARHAVPPGAPPGRCLPTPLGRCVRHGERVGPPPLAVEAATAATGAALGAWAPGRWLPLLIWLALLGTVLAFVDAAVKRLPDALTLPLFLGTAALVPLADPDPEVWLRCALAAAALGLLFLLFAFFAPMGLGDAKLAPSLGAALALGGWRAVYGGLFYMWVLAALWAVALLALRRAGRRTELAFGPAMLLGTLLALLAAAHR
ncbi:MULTISPECIES: prepilin peptidase [Kitasatospora]|uniref:Putative peptidase A24A family protein n=1 Tax=Kitasatospora setae (strain ATCC 33774 / DSM 43861 / JCM 3304 / KCC A-0304 / NBRC 14216 / KM-6054) TaxID=452652 RepID=E4NGB5_KITSK|nr:MULTISPECIES: prepilin peptidase [Kitasatospora]BAJ30545.1 putative peptidase A24A family protein [Kitasatospora setae KM-6054]